LLLIKTLEVAVYMKYTIEAYRDTHNFSSIRFCVLSYYIKSRDLLTI